MTSGSLQNYYGDEINDDANENNNNDHRLNKNKTTASKCFEYVTKIIGTTSNNNNIFDTEVVVPLKYLINFWRSLDVDWLDLRST